METEGESATNKIYMKQLSFNATLMSFVSIVHSVHIHSKISKSHYCRLKSISMIKTLFESCFFKAEPEKK